MTNLFCFPDCISNVGAQAFVDQRPGGKERNSMIFTLSECSHGRANSTSPLRWSRACQHVAPCLGPETYLCIRRRKLRQSAIMLNIRALDQLAKPGTLRPGIAWKIEHDGDPPFDKRAQTWAVRAFFNREGHFDRSFTLSNKRADSRYIPAVIHMIESGTL